MTKKIVFSIFFLSILLTDVLAQDFEEWRRQYLQEYQQFRDQRDSLFTDMLNRHWAQFEAFKAGEAWEEPKIEQIPDATTVERPRSGAAVPEDQIPPVRFDLPEFTPDEALALPPSPPRVSETSILFEAGFYNQEVRIELSNEIKDLEIPNEFNRNTIAGFWDEISRLDYQPLIESFNDERTRLGLNDWGYAKLLHQSAMEIYNNASMANLFTWFSLTKSGYDVRIGYKDNVYLLLPVQETIFAASFYEIEGKQYYVAGLGSTHPQAGALFTYEGSYPDAENVISTNISEIPRFSREILHRTLSFSYAGEDYEITVPINQNLISFYEYYPQTDFEVYFNAPVSSTTGETLLKELAEIIKDKSETEAVNILLRFVQTSFNYKVDPEQFGREKPMFPEETLYYPYSDCEDRAILFSFLVRHLTGLDVVGLHYPGHVATAVKFNVPVDGDAVVINGERWLIADPTYIHATIGMEMPDFQGKEAKIISVR